MNNKKTIKEFYVSYSKKISQNYSSIGLELGVKIKANPSKSLVQQLKETKAEIQKIVDEALIEDLEKLQ
jgi:hypothetical protein